MRRPDQAAASGPRRRLAPGRIDLVVTIAALTAAVVVWSLAWETTTVQSPVPAGRPGAGVMVESTVVHVPFLLVATLCVMVSLVTGARAATARRATR